jgi:hypothetical protein
MASDSRISDVHFCFTGGTGMNTLMVILFAPSLIAMAMAMVMYNVDEYKRSKDVV